MRLSKTNVTVHYDGDELILEKSGAAMLYYIHGPRIDELISDSRGYCYHSDGLGSIVNLTDSSGNKANSYTYMAFGQMRNQSGTVSNAWLFTGRQYDSESGLYYLRNRYYDPKTGRFITRDPIGIAGGINLYQYCGNNPVNEVDPWGLCKEKKGFSICPRYGNWGGLDWSGGEQVKSGDIGPYIDPIDQMDAYFREHDITSYKAMHLGEPSSLEKFRPDKTIKKAREDYGKEANKQLYRNLKSLPDDPIQWESPAPNSSAARRYRSLAEWYFKRFKDE